MKVNQILHVQKTVGLEQEKPLWTCAGLGQTQKPVRLTRSTKEACWSVQHFLFVRGWLKGTLMFLKQEEGAKQTGKRKQDKRCQLFVDLLCVNDFLIVSL